MDVEVRIREPSDFAVENGAAKNASIEKFNW